MLSILQLSVTFFTDFRDILILYYYGETDISIQKTKNTMKKEFFYLVISLTFLCQVTGCNKKTENITDIDIDTTEDTINTEIETGNKWNEHKDRSTESSTDKEDSMNTEKIRLFTQNSIRFESEHGIIYIDPFKMREEPHDADYILITHDHYDHYSPEDIRKVCKDTSVLVVPENMESEAGEMTDSVDMIYTVEPDIKKTINGLEVETIPAYNNKKSFHPKNAGWVGYILNIDGMRIYIAGDTDITEENRQVKCDVAMIPIGGTYTMDASQAAQLINEIKPGVAIPTHYGSVVGSPKDADTFKEQVNNDIEVSIKMEY